MVYLPPALIFDLQNAQAAPPERERDREMGQLLDSGWGSRCFRVRRRVGPELVSSVGFKVCTND